MSDFVRNTNRTTSVDSLRHYRITNESREMKEIRTDFGTKIKSHGHIRSNKR